MLRILFFCIAHDPQLFCGEGRALYPPFIYSFIWFADAALFWFAPIEVNEVHSITWWVIALGALVFSIGRLLTPGPARCNYHKSA